MQTARRNSRLLEVRLRPFGASARQPPHVVCVRLRLSMVRFTREVRLRPLRGLRRDRLRLTETRLPRRSSRKRERSLAGRQGFEPRYRGPESGSRASVRFGRLRFWPFFAPTLRSAPFDFGPLPCSLSHRVSAPLPSHSGLVVGPDLRSCSHLIYFVQEAASAAPRARWGQHGFQRHGDASATGEVGVIIGKEPGRLGVQLHRFALGYVRIEIE